MHAFTGCSGALNAGAKLDSGRDKRSAGIISVAEHYESVCSLELTHGAQQGTLGTLETMVFSGERERYWKLFKLIEQKRITLRVVSHGTCCWGMFSKTRFCGETQIIRTGYAVFPDFQPKSLQKHYSCP